MSEKKHFYNKSTHKEMRTIHNRRERNGTTKKKQTSNDFGSLQASERETHTNY